MPELRLRWWHGSLIGMVLLTAPARAEDQRAVLEILVNQVPTGESLVVLRGSDALVPVSALTRAGLQGLEGDRERVAEQEFVSLASLAPAVSFRVDERELRLHIVANPELLGRRVRDLFGGAPSDLQFRADSSAFLNYSVNHTTSGLLDLFTEAAASVQGALVYNTLSVSGGSATRGLSSVTFDQRRRMRRWTIGDSLAYAGPLGGDAWLAGISVSKEFALDPYFVRHPMLSLATPIQVPSVVEVQINGQVISREPVAPGRLELRNLPMTLGRNDAHVVVRDAFGVERELSSSYYLTTTALAKGVHDYQYSVGFRRLALGTRSWDYAAPGALARHRVGLSDTVSLGGHAAARPGLFNGGPSLNLRLPLGEVEATAAVSRHQASWGAASRVGFNYVGRPVSGGGSVAVASHRYTPLTLAPAGADLAAEATVFASARVGGPVSVTLQHTLARFHQNITRTRSGLLSTVRLARNIELTASGAWGRDEHGRSHELFAGVTVLFARDTASLAHLRDTRGNRVSVAAQRSLPAGEGFGYQIHAESGGGAASGAARYQGPHGRYEVRQENIAGQRHTSVSAMGSVVAIGGRVHVSRPVQDSFALVRVPGIEGVRASASHQVIGRTGRTGDLLIPDLQAYYGNILNVEDADIPLSYAVPAVRQTLALPYRGGAVALFDVQKVQQFVGIIVITDETNDRIPAYGEVTIALAGRTFSSPVGVSGAFYFENVPAGTYSATVRDSRGRQCRLTIAIPVSEESIVKIGTLRCRAELP